MTSGEQIIRFLFSLEWTLPLPEGIEVMNPFSNPDTRKVVEAFYRKFYSDSEKRWMIIGINPGRFGGGITGIPFTDPIRLEKECSIANPWQKKQELSSVFVYDVINGFGGPERFYRKFYISAVSPLGFTSGKKNLNYYDHKYLLNNINAFAVECIKRQLEFGMHRKAVFCLGDGKNYKFLSILNKEHGFFEEVIPLSHPRFIMQYKLKSKDNYLKRYLSVLEQFAAEYH